MKEICVAQIGCGYWGPNLLRSFVGLASCRVKWVVEKRAERQEYVRRTYPSILVSADCKDALEDEEVAGVIVATPARSHFQLAREALLAGKSVFVEKPLAMSVAEVDILAALSEKRSRAVLTGHTFLFSPAVRYLKELLHKGELGHVYYAYCQRVNLGVIRSDVNAMWNLAPHDVSILCYLLGGAPETVSAVGAAYIQPGVEDVVFLNLSFPKRIQASIHVSWLDPQKIRRLTIVGSRKMVVYDDMADHKVVIYDKGIDSMPLDDSMPFDHPEPYKLVHRSGDVLMPNIPSKEPLKEEAQHFLDCIASGKRPLTDTDHARQVIGVLELADRALAQARPVPYGQEEPA